MVDLTDTLRRSPRSSKLTKSPPSPLRPPSRSRPPKRPADLPRRGVSRSKANKVHGTVKPDPRHLDAATENLWKLASQAAARAALPDDPPHTTGNQTLIITLRAPESR